MEEYTNETMKEDAAAIIHGEAQEETGKKAMPWNKIWPMAFFLSLLVFLFLLLRAFPLQASSYGDLQKRPALLPTVRFTVRAQQVYFTGIEEVEQSTGEAVSTLLLYEMSDGKALLLVDNSTLKELSISAEPISLRGRMGKMEEDLSGEVQRVLQRYYDLDEEEAAEEMRQLAYLDLRWNKQSSLFVPLAVAALATVFFLVMSLWRGRKGKDGNAGTTK